MITDYLFMSYVAVVSCWPITLILLLLAIMLLLHAERKVLIVVIIVFMGGLAFAAWQLGQQYIPSMLSGGTAWLSE